MKTGEISICSLDMVIWIVNIANNQTHKGRNTYNQSMCYDRINLGFKAIHTFLCLNYVANESKWNIMHGLWPYFLILNQTDTGPKKKYQYTISKFHGQMYLKYTLWLYSIWQLLLYGVLATEHILNMSVGRIFICLKCKQPRLTKFWPCHATGEWWKENFVRCGMVLNWIDFYSIPRFEICSIMDAWCILQMPSTWMALFILWNDWQSI